MQTIARYVTGHSWYGTEIHFRYLDTFPLFVFHFFLKVCIIRKGTLKRVVVETEQWPWFFNIYNLSEWLSVVCRQAEEIMTMRGDGLGQISLRLLQSFSTRAYLSVTVSTFHSWCCEVRTACIKAVMPSKPVADYSCDALPPLDVVKLGEACGWL